MLLTEASSNKFSLWSCDDSCVCVCVCVSVCVCACVCLCLCVCKCAEVHFDISTASHGCRGPISNFHVAKIVSKHQNGSNACKTQTHWPNMIFAMRKSVSSIKCCQFHSTLLKYKNSDCWWWEALSPIEETAPTLQSSANCGFGHCLLRRCKRSGKMFHNFKNQIPHPESSRHIPSNTSRPATLQTTNRNEPAIAWTEPTLCAVSTNRNEPKRTEAFLIWGFPKIGVPPNHPC